MVVAYKYGNKLIYCECETVFFEEDSARGVHVSIGFFNDAESEICTVNRRNAENLYKDLAVGIKVLRLCDYQ